VNGEMARSKEMATDIGPVSGGLPLDRRLGGP